MLQEERSHASTMIQKSFRMRMAWKTYESQRNAASTIARAFRVCCARALLGNLKRKHASKVLQQKISAIKIQSFFRMVKERLQHLLRLQWISDIVIVQSVIRMHIQRREYIISRKAMKIRMEMLSNFIVHQNSVAHKRTIAAKMIQNCVRTFFLKKKEAAHLHKRLSASRIIIAAYRVFRAGQELKRLKNNHCNTRRSAATLIQHAFRARAVRKYTAELADRSNTKTKVPEAVPRVYDVVVEKEGYASFMLVQMGRSTDQQKEPGVATEIIQYTKRRFSEFFQFDRRLRSAFDAVSYNLPTLPPKTWCRNVKNDFLCRRASALNVYLYHISKEEDIVNSHMYKEFMTPCKCTI